MVVVQPTISNRSTHGAPIGAPIGNNMDKLSDLISGRLDRHNLSSSAKSAEVLYKANLLLSDLFKSQDGSIKAYRLENGILFISTESAVWSQEVWGVSEDILKNLKKSFGEKTVKKILIKSLTIK